MRAATLEALDDAEERGEMKRQDNRQRELDDARESGLAFFAGKEARRGGAAAGMNPYTSDHEIVAWVRGWSTIDGEIAADALARRTARAA
jgi:hypothetical protein